MSPESVRTMVKMMASLMAVERGLSYRVPQNEINALTHHVMTMFRPGFEATKLDRQDVARRMAGFIRGHLTDHFKLVTEIGPAPAMGGEGRYTVIRPAKKD